MDYYPVFYSHNIGIPNEPKQFAKIEFIDCDFGQANIQGGAAKVLKLKRTRCGEVSFSADIEAEECRLVGLINAGPLYKVSERNCYHTLTGMLRPNPLAGTSDIKFCTFDARGITSVQGGLPESALFNRTSAIELSFVNNLVLMSPSHVYANVFSGFKHSDTIEMKYNAYSLNGNTLVYAYDDNVQIKSLNFPAWKALGFDSASFQNDMLTLEDNGQPPPGSPLIDKARNEGERTDLFGHLFISRNDIGAVEAPPINYEAWLNQNFDEEWLLMNPDLVQPEASATSDGVSNLEKYFAGSNALCNSATSLKIAKLANEDILEIKMYRSRYLTDMSVEIKQSNDLVNWVDINAIFDRKSISNSTEELVFHFPLLNHPKIFFKRSLRKN